MKEETNMLNEQQEEIAYGFSEDEVYGKPIENNPTYPLELFENDEKFHLDKLSYEEQALLPPKELLQDKEAISTYMKEKGVEISGINDPETRLKLTKILIVATEGMYALADIFELPSIPTLEEAIQNPHYNYFIVNLNRGIGRTMRGFHIQENDNWFTDFEKAQKESTAKATDQLKSFLIREMELHPDIFDPKEAWFNDQALVYFLIGTYKEKDQAKIFELINVLFLEKGHSFDHPFLSDLFSKDTYNTSDQKEYVALVERWLKTIVYWAHCAWEASQIELRFAAHNREYPEGKEKKQANDRVRISNDHDFAVLPQLIEHYLRTASPEGGKAVTNGKVTYDLNVSLEGLVGKGNWERIKIDEVRKKALANLLNFPNSASKLKEFFQTFYLDNASQSFEMYDGEEKLNQDLIAKIRSGEPLTNIGFTLEEVIHTLAAAASVMQLPIKYMYEADLIEINGQKKTVTISAEREEYFPGIRNIADKIGYELVFENLDSTPYLNKTF